MQLMNWAGTETIQAEELTVIPGLDEIFALIDVKTHVECGRYDCSSSTARPRPRRSGCCRCPRS